MQEAVIKTAMRYSVALFLLAFLFTAASYLSQGTKAEETAYAAGKEAIGTDATSLEGATSLKEGVTRLADTAGGNYTVWTGYQVWNTFFGVSEEAFANRLGKACFVLPKETAGGQIKLEEQLLTASLRIFLPECEEIPDTGSLFFVCEGECYEISEEASIDLREHEKRVAESPNGGFVLQGMLWERGQEGAGTSLLLELDTIYESFLYEDEMYYYISLKRPAELYEKIVVLDAGHGGNDPGTGSAGYVYTEKDTNLAVIAYVEELLRDREDMKVYYTRLTDIRPSLEQRVGVANALDADLFISVHCNANETKTVHGTEVLYNSSQNGMKPLDSKRLAEICLEHVAQEIGLTKRFVIDRTNDVYIVGHANMPVALIELGYMSNTTDLKALVAEETRRRAAEGICAAIDAAFKEIEEVGEEQ